MEVVEQIKQAIPGELFITQNSGFIMYCGTEPDRYYTGNKHLFYSYQFKTILKYTDTGNCWSFIDEDDSEDYKITSKYDPDLEEMAKQSKDPESFKAGYKKAQEIYEALAGK